MNLPTVLQSLGCIAKYSISTFDDHDQDEGIVASIYEKIFQVIPVPSSLVLLTFCLHKSFLPVY